MSLRCPDELAREILRSTLAFVSDVYSRPGARASTIAAAVEGRMAAAMTVAEWPDLLRELFDLRMAAACASGTASCAAWMFTPIACAWAASSFNSAVNSSADLYIRWPV